MALEEYVKLKKGKLLGLNLWYEILWQKTYEHLGL